MNIPVSFEYESKKYIGYLSEVLGAGTEGGEWHLMVNNYYWGRLRKVNDEWFFDESKWPIEHLKDYFASVVIAYFQ